MTGLLLGGGIPARCQGPADSAPPTVYVGPAGDDSWSGRLDRPNETGSDGPLKHLEAALSAVRRYPADQPRRIVVLPGDYFLAKPLELDARDQNLTIEAEPGRAVLIGGRVVDNLQREGDHWVSAALDGVADGDWDFRALVVNGRLCPRARLPQTGTFTHDSEFNVPWMSTTGGGWQRKPTAEELTALKCRLDDLPADLELRNVEITVYHMWDESLVGAKSLDPSSHTITFSNPAGHPPGAFGVKKYVLWNIRQGMRPGSWLLDRAAGKVVYWPLPGEDPGHLQVYAPVTESLIRVQGRPDAPASNIRIQGLALTVTTTPLVAGGFGAGRFAGAVDAQNAPNLELRSLEIYNVAGQGIRIHDKAARVERCHVHHTGACGIRAPSSTIQDNYLHHVGLIYPSAIACWGGGRDGVIRHNEIHDTPYTAINCGGENHRIENNRIYRAMLELHDGGGIYVFAGKGVVLRGNYISDIPDTGGYGSSAYYLDERSEDCLVERNLSVGIARPSHNHMAHGNTLRENVFLVDGDARLTFARSDGYTMTENIIVADGSITLASADAVAQMHRNVFYSRSGRILNQQMQQYQSGRLVPLAAGPDNRFADPRILSSADGAIGLADDSPARQLGIAPLDVSTAGRSWK
ncbi:MAG: right-handed parallel beta-helix repeat-containing protein [Sedimentisphaerales bacterium]|nr:right-handed parallel beta-helix repeat-containing protein [Sedimentisphaerales bacterium]